MLIRLFLSCCLFLASLDFCGNFPFYVLRILILFRTYYFTSIVCSAGSIKFALGHLSQTLIFSLKRTCVYYPICFFTKVYTILSLYLIVFGSSLDFLFPCPV
jgi:hypothetical protein